MMKAEQKPLYDSNRMILADEAPLDTPLALPIEISSVCNIHCCYCIHALKGEELKAAGVTPSLMDWSVFTAIVEQMAEFPGKIKSVYLQGLGEPLCNQKLPEMIRYIKERNVTTNIEVFTNGLLLDKEWALKLAGSGLTRLRISLQGLTAKKYKEICGTDMDFDRFVSNIRFFYENKKDCQLFIKIVDAALEDKEESIFLEIFGDICDRICVEQVNPIFSDVDYKNINRGSETDNRYGKTFSRQAVCPNSFYKMCVNVKGDVGLCSLSKIPVKPFNILEKSLFDIWNSKERIDFLKEQLMGKRFENSVCKDCNLLYTTMQSQDLIHDGDADKILERLEKAARKNG